MVCVVICILYPRIMLTTLISDLAAPIPLSLANCRSLETFMLWVGDESEGDRPIPWLQVDRHRAYARLLSSLATSAGGGTISSPHPLRTFILKIPVTTPANEDPRAIEGAMVARVWEPLEDVLLKFPLLSRVVVLFDGVEGVEADSQWKEAMGVQARACFARLSEKVILDVEFRQEASLRGLSSWYTELSLFP